MPGLINGPGFFEWPSHAFNHIGSHCRSDQVGPLSIGRFATWCAYEGYRWKVHTRTVRITNGHYTDNRSEFVRQTDVFGRYGPIAVREFPQVEAGSLLLATRGYPSNNPLGGGDAKPRCWSLLVLGPLYVGQLRQPYVKV